MDKDIPKIETETKETYRNTRTGQVYETREEANFDLTAREEEIVKDVTVTVTNKGLDLLQKVMQDGKKPKA